MKNRLSLLLFFVSLSLAQQAQELAMNKAAVDLQVLPVSFRQNFGQWDEKIVYQGFSPGWNANINFLENGLSFGLVRESEEGEKEEEKEREEEQQKGIHPHRYAHDNEPKERLVWNLCFKNMDPGATVVAEGKQDSHTNYLLGNDPAKHQVNVPDYRIIRYQNIYPGIDVKYYSTGKNIKYDFILEPGADISRVKMECQGVQKVSVNAKKQLEIKTLWGTLIEEMPESYQVISGQKILVSVEYVALNSTTFGFKVNGGFDKNQTLIIDPVILAWGTYVGSTSSTDEGYCHAVAVDPAGNVYATGFYEGGFPVTPGAYGTTYMNMRDVFVYKLTPDATSLIYATYLGGSNSDWGYGITVNTAGEVFVTGQTSSTGFPVTSGAYQTTYGGGAYDVFLTKLNASGTAPVFSTFIGGNDADEGFDIAINSVGESFLTGVASLGYPTTPGSFQPAILSGGVHYNAFITKVNANGNGLVYSSFLGGNSGEYGYGVAVDPTDQAYITGETGSWTTFPTTPGAFMTNYGNCGWKAFVAKINASGTAKIYCTFLGGSGNCPQNGVEVGNDIAVNAAGEAFVTGCTSSSNYPTTSNAYDKTYNGQGDIFLTKLNASGTAAIYSTYYGGGMGETACGIAVNSAGEAYITGFTETDDGTFPITSCAYQSVFGGQSTSTTGRGDIYLAKFNASGSTLLYSTFMGGSGDDYKYPKVALHGACEEEVIVNGTSHSSNFPTTAGVYMQQKGNGPEDQTVVFKLKPKVDPFFLWDTPNCNLTVNFTDSTTGNCIWQAGPWTPGTWFWDFGDGTTSTQQNPTHTYAASGTYQVKLLVTCPKDSIIIPITVSTTGGSASIAPVSPICIGSSVVLAASGGSGYTWSTGATTATITVTPTVTTTYSVQTIGNCPGSATVTVVVNPLPLAQIGSNSPLCVNQNLSLTSSGGVTYAWSGPNGFTSAQQNPSIIGASPVASGTYSVTVTNVNGCMASAVTSVTVNPALTVQYIADTVCQGSGTTFIDITPGVPPGTAYNWSFGDGTSSTQSTSVSHAYQNSGTYTTTLSIGNSITCINTGTLQVVVKALPTISHVDPLLYCPSQLTQQVYFNSTPGGSSSVFFWANTNTAIGLAAGGTGNLPSFTTANLGNGSITAIILVHAAYNGCTGPDSMFTITINPNPTADFFGQNKICLGNPVQFTDQSSVGVAQWNWDMNHDGNYSDATAQDPSYTFTSPGTHTVSLIVSVNSACRDTIEKIVYVNPIPQPNFAGDHLMGCPVLPVMFADLSAIASPSAINNWLWNFGNGNTFSGQFPPAASYHNFSHTQSATYTVSLTVTSDSGCIATLTRPNYITVFPRPIAEFSYSSNLNEMDGIDPTIHFYDQSTGANQVHWHLGDVFSNPASLNYTWQQNPSHTYLHEESYTYYVTQWAVNSFGCIDSITKPIEAQPGFTYYIPNAFSPDGDGINDGFKGTGVGIDNSTYHLMVFDRWGNMIFRSNNLEETWNGTVNNAEVVQEDVYVWKADFKDFSGKKHEYKGTVSVLK